MARRTVVELVDDIDGKPAQETVTFSLDGTAYEIDLSAENADRLRASFAPYLDQARKAGTARAERPVASPAAPGRGTSRTAHSREESARIRAWAKEHGITVNERGRIPSRVVEAYKASTGLPATLPSPAAPPTHDPVPAARPIPQVTFQAVSNP